MWRDCWIVLLSRPARALWIEIVTRMRMSYALLGSRPARALWIEICPGYRWSSWSPSRPARALWIEIG